MPTFLVKTTFEIPARHIAVVAGQVVDGDIKVGMLLHVPLNSGITMTASLDEVELIHADPSVFPLVALCIRGDDEDRSFLLALNLEGGTLEVTES